MDKRHLHKDGSPVWVHLSITLARTLGGDPDYVIAMVQDITERKRLEHERALLLEHERAARAEAEAALARASASEALAAERAERLHTILETIADGVAVVDMDGRVQLQNRAFRALHALERGPAGFDALPGRDRVRLMDVRDIATGAPLPFEYTALGRALRGEVVTSPSEDICMRAFDGRDLELNASAAPLRESDGRVAGAVLVLRDLTERNRLAREREEAREANQRMEEFLATAAHDLRTPVGSTVGFIDLADRKFQRLASAAQGECPALIPQVEAARGSLEEATQSGERLTRLVNVLFDTAALRVGKLELHRTRFDLAALVREQVEAQRMLAPRRSIRLHAPSGEPVQVNADAERLGQVMANYLTNALKYSPPDRPVRVYVQADEGWARVAVRDEGPGLPKEEQARVWEQFHQAPGVATQGGLVGGLGLGLHICKEIIEAHGGQVGVESALGRGSTFWFTLPLAGTSSPGA